MPVDTTKQSWYFVTGIAVAPPRDVGAVVALGDSLTDAQPLHGRRQQPVTDALATKLHAACIRMDVMNQGTGGGRVPTT